MFLANVLYNDTYDTSQCAGKSMALDTIWIAVASILSVYNISKAVDDRGNTITPEVKLKPGTVWFVIFSPLRLRTVGANVHDQPPSAFQMSN